MKYRYVGAFRDDLKPGDIYQADGNCYVVLRNGVRLIHYVVDPADSPKDGNNGRDGRNGVDGRDGRDAEPTINYRGDWKRAEYVKGDVVTYDKQTWIATVATKSKPGVGKGWSLFAAKGKDGIDGKAIEHFYTRVVKRIGGDSESHPLAFTASPGQCVTVNGLASMVDPHAIGFAVESSLYRTEGTVTIPGLTPGAIYYLDEFVAGAISATAPTNGFRVVVGRAIDSNTLDIEISPPIRL